MRNFASPEQQEAIKRMEAQQQSHHIVALAVVALVYVIRDGLARIATAINNSGGA